MEIPITQSHTSDIYNSQDGNSHSQSCRIYRRYVSSSTVILNDIHFNTYNIFVILKIIFRWLGWRKSGECRSAYGDDEKRLDSGHRKSHDFQLHSGWVQLELLLQSDHLVQGQ